MRGLKFSLELVDGDRLGKLTIPFTQLAEWLNLLTSPHYGVAIVHTEQGTIGVTIYFEASEVLYWYISDRLGQPLVQTVDYTGLQLAS